MSMTFQKDKKRNAFFKEKIDEDAEAIRNKVRQISKSRGPTKDLGLKSVGKGQL